jgi:hypothetical protein
MLVGSDRDSDVSVWGFVSAMATSHQFLWDVGADLSTRTGVQSMPSLEAG